MSERIGVCGGCGMKFKVPDTFQGSQAKCKKCGGVVTISGGAAAAPAAAKPAIAPKAAPAAAKPAVTARPSAAKAAAASAPATGKAGSSRAAGRASKAGASGAGKRGAAAPKKDNTMMIVGIAAAVLVLGGGAYFMMKDDKSADDATNTATTPVEAPKEETPPPAPVVETPVVDPVTPTPEVAPPVEAPKPAEPEPAATEELPSVVEFPAFEKPSVITDEQWTAAQDAVRVAFIESSRPKQRGEAMKVLNEQPVAAIGAMVNGLIGLDLAQEKTFITAGQIVKGIQTVSFDVVKIPYKLDILEMGDNVQFNARCLQNLSKYWAKEMANAEKFAEKIQAARDKPPEDLDDN